MKGLRILKLRYISENPESDEDNQSMTNDISSKVLFDIDFLPEEEFQKAKKFLESINESQIVSINNKGSLIFSNKDTAVLPSKFLYSLHQTSLKLNDVYYHILYRLNIPTHFTTYSNKILEST